MKYLQLAVFFLCSSSVFAQSISPTPAGLSAAVVAGATLPTQANLDAVKAQINAKLVADSITAATASAINATAIFGKSVPAIYRPNFGIIIPSFLTTNKLDNLNAPLGADSLVIASGGGLIANTSGVMAQGNMKLPYEIIAYNKTRTDFKCAFNMSSTSDTQRVGVGSLKYGYIITMYKSGSNFVVNFPMTGKIVTGAVGTGNLTGTVNFSVSFTTAKGYITASIAMLDTTASNAMATTNPFRVPQYDVVKCMKRGLMSAYFASNSTSSKILGFLHNTKTWDGDPTGQLLTRSAVANCSGQYTDNESIVFLPIRTSVTTPIKIVQQFHGRTLDKDCFTNLTIADSGETVRILLNRGFIVMAGSGAWSGFAITNVELDGWGNSTSIQRASDLYDAVFKGVTNVSSSEYLIGWSMGGATALNYTRMHPDRVKGIFLSCPAIHLQDSSGPLACYKQFNTSMGIAYSRWYYGKSSNSSDPALAGDSSNADWICASQPGALPNAGFRALTQATVASASTSYFISVTGSGAAKINAGDVLFFKNSGQTRQYVQTTLGTNTSLNLDSNITVAAGENISVYPADDINAGYDYRWATRTTLVWTSGNTAGAFAKRQSTTTLYQDLNANNPMNFVDLFAAYKIPIYIRTSGPASGNDVVLYNQQMYDFGAKVNAIQSGVVTMFQGSGGHIAGGTLSATDTYSLFSSN